VRTDVPSLSADDAGNFQRTRDNGGQFDDDVDFGTDHSSPGASAAASLNADDLMSEDEVGAGNVNEYSAVQFEMLDNEQGQYNYIGSAAFTKRRKPPEYVGYAVNVDPNVDAQEQTATSKEFLTNTSDSVDGAADKTNAIKLPAPDELYSHGGKADQDRVWETTCRELNCVRGSMCVPDILRDRQPRCQCPLGTDGPRCERRTLAIQVYL